VSRTEEATAVFQDYYDVLELSPKANPETIDRVYRILVKRYHPDNQDTGDPHKFAEVVEAYRTLSDPETRQAYDIHHEGQRAAELGISQEASDADGFSTDLRTFETILSLLYVSRRRDPARGGLGVVQMEHMLERPAQYLEFHLWYLREKGCIERLDNGLFAITATGIDRVMQLENISVRRDRLIAEHSSVERQSLKEQVSR